MNKTIKIKELNIEVETKLHTEMNRIDKIKIPKGWRLLTLSEWIFIYNKYKNNMDYGGKPDEIVSQPIEENKDKYPYWNVWFGGLGYRSELLGFDGGLGSGLRVRGVRFCREMK
jgi:hypothetical protein